MYRDLFSRMTHLENTFQREIFYASTRFALSTGYELGRKAGNRWKSFANIRTLGAYPEDKFNNFYTTFTTVYC